MSTETVSKNKDGRLFDLRRCFMEAERFAKAAYTLCTRFTGLPDGQGALDRALFLPSVVFDGLEHRCYYSRPPGRNPPDDMDYVGPYAMNGALAIELYLKSLLVLSLGPSAAKRIHQFDILYESLPLGTQRRLEGHFQAALLPKDQFDMVAVSIREIVADFHWELSYLLTQSSSAFVQFRYAHDLHWGWFAGFREARIAIRHEILHLDPTLASPPKPGVPPVA